MKKLLLLALAVALTQGASVSATWEASVSGVNLTVTYAAEVEVSTDKTWVLLPGEEVELRCRTSGGNLTLQLIFPQGFPGLGGRVWRYQIPLNPGEVYKTEFEVAPTIRLRLYAVVKIVAEVSAAGASPAAFKTEVPCFARFNTYGTASFNVALYAAPTVGLEVTGPGITLNILERKIAEAPMLPGLSAQVHSVTPLLTLIAATAVAIYAIRHMLKRRSLQNTQRKGLP